MKIFIEPADVLFFRDSRSFNRGDDNVARMVFPPTPMPFYGALRSSLISESWDTFADFVGGVETAASSVVGSASQLGSLSITHFSLGLKTGGKVEPLFPIPADLVGLQEGEETMVLSPRKAGDNMETNMPSVIEAYVIGDGALGLQTPSGFLNAKALSEYLKGIKISRSDIIPESDLFVKEHRVGIARAGDTGIAREGMLYSAEFARLNKTLGDGSAVVGFWIGVEGDGGLLSGRGRVLRLGGESRTSFCETGLDQKANLELAPPAGRFKSILLTPAVFTNGWIPDGLDPATGEGVVAGRRVKLISAIVKRSIPISGWDIAQGRPKPARRAVPQGSVYYFESLDSARIDSAPLTVSLCEDELYSKQGFGLSILGEWNHV
jgi:CRISPR-associated protein Cmr3